MSEYSFSDRRKKRTNPQLVFEKKKDNLSQFDPKKVKQTIMQQYDKFLDLKVQNERCRYLSETQDKISKEIVENFKLLKGCSDPDQSTQLQNKLEHLNNLYTKLKTEYTEFLQKELDILYDTWPDIFEKIIEGVDRATLEHVLSVYDAMQNGQLTENQAVGQGIDYMTMKYNLPPDFFDKGAIDQYKANRTLKNMI